MQNTAIGVAAAVLFGGGVLYGGYQLLGDEERQDRSEVSQGDVADAKAPAAAARAGTGRGVPAGTGGMNFAEGAEGERVTQEARADSEEAAREAERLAMLSTGDLDLGAAPGDMAEARAGQAADNDDQERARGLRDAPTSMGDTSGQDPDRERPDSDVERLLADIAARSGANEGEGEEAAGDAPRGTEAGTARYVANARQTDKPDRGGFAANRRQIDKPDDGGFVASADTERFDPCMKADGTPYVGPGTALNPFAETDPCLPKATSQSYQLANVETAARPPVERAAPNEVGMPFVDVARPRLPPIPPVGIGSDYRG